LKETVVKRPVRTMCVVELQLIYALTQYRVVRSTLYSGADMRTTPPKCGAQNGSYGNAGWLATGPLNLHFMAAYFKNYFYKLVVIHVYLARALNHVPQFW